MLGSLAEVLPSSAARFGDRRALVVGDRSFSFTELDGPSSALAASLVTLGVAPGSWAATPDESAAIPPDHA